MVSFRYMKVSVRRTPSMRADPLVDQLQQVLVVVHDDLGQQVERAGGDHHVVDLVESRPARRRPPRASPSTLMPIIACRAKPICMRVGDRDDLHDAGLDQLLHPLPHRGLGQPDRLADAGVGPATVLLQLLDDRLGGVIQLLSARLPAGGSSGNGSHEHE